MFALGLCQSFKFILDSSAEKENLDSVSQETRIDKN